MQHVDPPVAIGLPAYEILGAAGVVGEVLIRDGDLPRVVDDLIGRDDALVEGSDSGDELEGRAGREG